MKEEVTQAEVLRLATLLEARGYLSNNDDLKLAVAVMRTAVDDFQLNNLAMATALMMVCDLAHTLGRDLAIHRDVVGRVWTVSVGAGMPGTPAAVRAMNSGLLPALAVMRSALEAIVPVPEKVYRHVFEHEGIFASGWKFEAKPSRYAVCTAGKAAELLVGLGVGWSCRVMFDDEIMNNGNMIG